eukprot:11623246-Ditylum_brightwellii.AAC.1
MPEDTVTSMHQIVKHVPLCIVVEDSKGTKALHEPPPEQFANSDDDASCSPEKDGGFLMEMIISAYHLSPVPR